MILQSLNQLYDRLSGDPTYEIAPPGFSPQKVSFKIVLREDGSLFAIEDARIQSAKGKKIPALLEVPAHEKRTSGVKAQFLCDKREYILGLSSEGIREDCFQEFKRKHLEIEQSINSDPYSIVCRFLQSWNPSDAQELSLPDEVFDNFGIFQILGERVPVHNDKFIRDWWIEEGNKTSEEAYVAQCLVSGETREICRIHPDIKGFKSSVALVGIQVNTSYESYGRSKTENCPISNDVAFRYATALNALTAGPKKSKHSFSLANTKVIFWTETPTLIEDCFADLFDQGSSAENKVQDANQLSRINRVLEAIKSGTKYQPLGEREETPFYLLGLEQPNPGRFSIRFFHRSTVGDLLQKLHDHQKCLRVVREFENPKGKRPPDPEFPAVWQLLDQVAPIEKGKPNRDKIPPLLGGALTRSIIEGTNYPEGLYSAVIRRIHADRTIHYLRAAILKAVLVRNHKIIIPEMLDKNQHDPAYLLGRLFSALEKTQEEAQPAINATIRDRFYSAASATPASVFPRLLRTYQHHLAKLYGGAKVNREKLIQEILSDIESSGFPAQLNLKSQGLFAIGYYHQRKDFFTSKNEHAEPEAVQLNLQ